MFAQFLVDKPVRYIKGQINGIQLYMVNGMKKRDTSGTASGNAAVWYAAGRQERRFDRPRRSIWLRGATKFGEVIGTPRGNNIPRRTGLLYGFAVSSALTIADDNVNRYDVS